MGEEMREEETTTANESDEVKKRKTMKHIANDDQTQVDPPTACDSEPSPPLSTPAGPSTDLSTPPPSSSAPPPPPSILRGDESYHAALPERMKILDLDPSVAVAFFCRHEEDFRDLLRAFQRPPFLVEKSEDGRQQRQALFEVSAYGLDETKY